MKRKIIALLMFLIAGNTFAHYLWIETNPVGSENKKHEVKVRFGEYTYGVIEKVNGEAFKNVSQFNVWLIAPDGSKSALEVAPKDDHYLGVFIPGQTGTYTVVLDNKNMNVLDYTQYDFGIFKPQYHAKAKVSVGETADTARSNADGIEIVDISSRPAKKGEEVALQVLFKGEPLIKNEIVVYVSDLWSKKMETDEKGEISFKLPWKTIYTVEATYNETTPGTFKNADYEFIWHCATYCIKL
ncbi:DUF4198 domain-containing protein [Zhouia spongiae]|uniref:DUF4198 domain-containing protein n=1 Tax=Zhouia spongiae TaxID=2202721 RepID=A0ABY3YKN9_9FLAO|nr:DUF4198 domain-containing protein [Zhouia spongiae]UNY98374.1 DUF4198 domain-containing protein [Zhouia spongiae]